MLLILLFGFYWGWPAERGSALAFGPLGGGLLLFILLVILGLAVFGWPIKG